ncbi:lipopolysaccharide biosynthesis protein [Echinicola rosea]|uniref:Lipopolysaccharide biosynthesis protein n=1 Tax=Echinicola rosea TaxID=1807691 RepID=A0ABQ1VCK3_9BACT|nr:lipopolysaccharide biosynthesis protein [Echinicola rosea]GGF51607.1 lipopolysaccharide biosynthesis protein [Echinicola rosea]
MSGSNSKILVVKGVFWSGIQLVVNQSFSFIIKLVLAKLLFPEDFGLIGMAVVFTGFVQVLNDLGIASALVQKKEEDLKDSHFHTAFWTGLAWGGMLYLLMCLLVAPLASSFYQEPLLQDLIPVLSLGILSSPINLVHKAQLTKAMNFKKIAVVENISSFVSGVIAITLAFMGAGVWSLAFNAVASIVVAMPLYFNATKWTPKLMWEQAAFKDVFGFGLYTTGTSIVNYLIGNFDYLMIGKLLDSQLLGVYTFAFVLTDTFRSKLMSVINKVMYPVYGKMQSSEKSLKKYYLTTVNYNSIIIFPIMLFMIVLGEQFILDIFGEKWEESVAPLSILAFAVMIHMMVNSNTSLIRGMGKPRLELTLQIIKSLIFIPTLFFGIHFYGILGAAWAVVVNKIIAVIIAQYTFNKLLMIKISTGEFWNVVKSPWIASVITYSIMVYLNRYDINLIISTLILFVIYYVVIWLLMGKEIKQQVSNVMSESERRSNQKV